MYVHKSELCGCRFVDGGRVGYDLRVPLRFVEGIAVPSRVNSKLNVWPTETIMLLVRYQSQMVDNGSAIAVLRVLSGFVETKKKKGKQGVLRP